MKNALSNEYSKISRFVDKTGVFYSRCFSILIFFAALLWILANLAPAQNTNILDLSNPLVRQRQVERLAEKSRRRKQAAWEMAQKQGWLPKQTINNTAFELMAIENGRFYIYKTCNVNAAISIAADLIRNTPPYYLNGDSFTVGIWDAGAVRPTHQEFSGRVTVMETMSNHDHSTHVGGTIAAAGVISSAIGMAPSALIDSYEWNDDVSEMTSRAMSYPNEPGKIQVSNHSYSYICGWEHGYSPPRWYGTWGYRESDYFGIYDSYVAPWDQLCYNAPYYLPFKAVGNDRNDQAPDSGQTFAYYDPPPPLWKTKTYNPSTDPYSDGWDNGGFDTVTTVGVAKNIITVGAVYDAVSAGIRDTNQAAMATFSGWGPTDDGRIKPDIVTNGIALYSPIATSNSSYDTYGGTSMATPSAAGAAMLLTQYYSDLFAGQFMRASTIKALIIHTADDLGNPGPDYKFGWGLLNAKAAADQIADHSSSPGENKIVEDLLDDVNTTAVYTFECSAAGPIKATLCWTDPPATALTSLDDPSPRLVNDLDLRITDPNGSTTYYPFVLNPSSPNSPATTGDNTLDNVEQVLIAAPNLPGTYTAQITYKSTLTNDEQYFSLILSGKSLTDFNGDDYLDNYDLEILTGYWLTDEPSVDIAPDGGDGFINFLDFRKFAQTWNRQ